MIALDYLYQLAKRLKRQKKITLWQLLLDGTIAKTSVFLPELFHKNPADRIIIATAIREGATLITSDKRILRYPHVHSVW